MEIMDDIYGPISYQRNNETLNYCDHVESTVTIRWNGDIIPCCYDLSSNIILGNIHECNLAAIWNNNKYLKLRKSIDTKSFYHLCANCIVVNAGEYLTIKPDALVNS